MQPIFPFEKNRYFPRKRMRSADFDRELQYIEHKFQFLSHWIFGAGVVAGLEVQRLDSDSLLISPGAAVDDRGRCVIVDEPAVCRIRTLPGFGALKGETALLWLSYSEEQKEPVIVPGEKEERSEFSVAAERFAFSLSQWNGLQTDAVDARLYSRKVLYEDDTLRVSQAVPRVLSSKRPVELRLSLENLSLGAVSLQVRYQPKLPGFRMSDGGTALGMDRQVELPGGGSCTLPLTAVPETTAQSVELTLPKDGLILRLQGRELHPKGGFREEFKLTSGDPAEAMAAQLRTLSLQDLWGEEERRGVPIAAVRFLRYDEGFLLDDVIPLHIGERAHFPDLERRLDRWQGCFPNEEEKRDVPPYLTPADGAEAAGLNDTPRYMTTGVALINGGLHMGEGKILYTDEIVHNLGPGPVYVDFGVEDVYPVVNMDRNGTDLLLGDSSLFVQSSGVRTQNFDKGVRLHPDKGTFELALRLKGELRQTNLRLRWFAWRPRETVERPPAHGKLIRLEPSVIYAEPGSVVHFLPVFDGDSLPCDFSVPERQDGLINRDGVYTAPQREGLYQVCAQVREKPENRTSAFVIVRAREEESGHDTDPL